MTKKIIFTVLWVMGSLLVSAFFLGFASVIYIAERTKRGGLANEPLGLLFLVADCVVPLFVGAVTLFACMSGKFPGTRNHR
jgi:hypothetical protein